MTSEQHGRDTETLGQLLQRTRSKQGLDLKLICEETRISNSNLRAMETDDYGALPADAFARGFYTLYAKKLSLDPDEIVSRFMDERGTTPQDGATAHNPPQVAARQVSNMAEPSNGSPLSTIGYILLLLIILSGGISWYFNINPATFISEQLRSLQSVEETQTAPAPKDTEQ